MPSLLNTASISEARAQIAQARSQGHQIGCVPTMGALHAGHLSLIKEARRECGYVVVTVFVNPTQFGPNEDFQEYPRSLEADLAVCNNEQVDLVFCPERSAMYPPDSSTIVEVEGLSRVLEGTHRPRHFRGVATIVLKLFNALSPDVAFFGRKDFQQQRLIRQMCQDLLLPVEIRTCPTIREDDGLALSSRNIYLDTEERQVALRLSQSLFQAETRLKQGEQDVSQVICEMREYLTAGEALSLDYFTIADPTNLQQLSDPQSEMIVLVAARVGSTRLIDNLPITLS